MKTICLLGASGSIGTQTIEVIEKYPLEFSLIAFSVGHNDKNIENILIKHPNVKYVFLLDKSKADKLSRKYKHVSFFSGEHDLENIISLSKPNMVVNALVGFAGLLPSIKALEENCLLALANKESLVVGGEFINKLLNEGKGKLYPIDSEHSAIWKCLLVDDQNVDKLVITASGGAFRKLSRDELKNVTKEDALNHPTWKMGNKITIDCATMMNKGFEIIEAYYLFGYGVDKICVKMHDESMLHSAVKYKDGTYRGELNPPDMKNPIKFALFEGKTPFETVSFNEFKELKDLHFREFDSNRYPMVSLSKLVIMKGGNQGAIINASNEVAVNAFLNDKISFLDIEKIVYQVVESIPFKKANTVDELIMFDKEARELTNKLIMEANK